MFRSFTLSLPLSELRTRLGQVIDQAHYAGTRTVVTRNGKEAAVIISPQELAFLDRLEATADAEALRQARAADTGERFSFGQVTKEIEGR